MSNDANDLSGALYVGLERGPTSGEIEAVYDYTDEHDRLLFQIVRFRPKAFRTRRPDGQDGWIYGLEGVPRVLYRLPHVIAADTVLVVEGEKDVATAEGLALPARWVATCSPFGACQWLDAYSRVLASKAVYICPDTDKAGHDHLMQVGLSLIRKAREIRVVALPPTVKDLSEWIEGGADAEDFGDLLRNAETFPFPRDDSELVRDVRSLEDALARVCRLRGVVLEGRALPGGPARIEMGFLPHEVAPLVPGWISPDGDGNPAISARGFEALATAAIQKLSADIRAVSELRRDAVSRLERLEDAQGQSHGPG
jgi:hypothetical protein